MTNKELKEALQQKAQKMEDLPIRTVEEHNEYIKKLQDEEKDIVKLSVLIASTSDKQIKLNNLCQEFYRQIDVNGFTGKGLERWYVKAEKLNEDGSFKLREDGTPETDVAIARYRHKDKVEILVEEGSDNAETWDLLGKKAKSNNHVLYSVDDFPSEDFIKKLMSND